MSQALHHPGDVCGLVLAPPTGGGATSPVSMRYLSESYYLQHAKRARAGGMEAVVDCPETSTAHNSSSHYKVLAGRSAYHRRALLNTDVATFAGCMEASAAFLHGFKDDLILGLHDAGLRAWCTALFTSSSSEHFTALA